MTPFGPAKGPEHTFEPEDRRADRPHPRVDHKDPEIRAIYGESTMHVRMCRHVCRHVSVGICMHLSARARQRVHVVWSSVLLHACVPA